MVDPIQQLIDAGAVPSSPFGPDSRYRDVALGLFQRRADTPGVPYVLRRFIPAPDTMGLAGIHRVSGGDRPDRLGALFLGDPLLYWRIADANAVVDPHELTDVIGRGVRLPLPSGL